MDKQAGFTLVEVVVSIVVFVMVVVGLSSVFVSTNKLIIHNRERMTSAQLGKFYLDPLQAHVRKGTGDELDTELKWDGTSNELKAGTTWVGVSQTINNRSFSESHAVTAVDGMDLRRVITTISWTEPTS